MEVRKEKERIVSPLPTVGEERWLKPNLNYGEG